MSGQDRSAASCCPTFAAGYGVHYSNCPKHDPVEDAARLPAAEAELERRMSSAATVEREYEVVKRTKAGTSIVWTGGCRNCAYMIAAAAQRDAPDARVSVVRCG